MISKIEVDKVKEEYVFFMNEGEKLVGVFHIPECIPAPTIIFCHGFTGNRIEAHRLFVYAARELCKRGFAALRFDFRGSGESEGSFQSMTISREISDLEAALSWLYEREEVLKDKIGVTGLSLGGVVAILTAARDERIRALCTWSTPAEFRALQNAAKIVFGEIEIEKLVAKSYIDLPSGDRIGREFLIDAPKHNILESVVKISPRPLLIIHGTMDPYIPIWQAEKLYKGAKEPKQKFFVDGADHTFNRWDWQWAVIRHTADWFEKALSL